MSLRYPFGKMAGSALAEIESQGWSVPPGSIFLSMSTTTILSPKLLDIFLSFSALCAASQFKASPVEGRVQSLTRETVKLGLRLVYMGEGEQALQVTHLPSCPGLHECLRLTLLVFIWGFSRKVMIHTTAMQTCHGYIQTLLTKPENTAFLEVCRGSTERFESRMLLWMVMVLGATAFSPKDKKFYGGLVHLYLPRFVNATFEDVEARCCEVLWLHFSSPFCTAASFWNYVASMKVEAA